MHIFMNDKDSVQSVTSVNSPILSATYCPKLTSRQCVPNDLFSEPSMGGLNEHFDPDPL